MGSSFDCTVEQHDKGCLLRLDYGVSASAATYKWYIQPIAFVCLGVFCVGIPASYYIALRTAVKSAAAQTTKEQWHAVVQENGGMPWYSFYGHCKPKYWWFECATMLRQCALSGVAVVAGDVAASYIFGPS
jgi:hypothetical protein